MSLVKLFGMLLEDDEKREVSGAMGYYRLIKLKSDCGRHSNSKVQEV